MKNRPKGSLLFLGIIWLMLLIGMAVPLSVQGGTTTRVSVASDGRYVAFGSLASESGSDQTNQLNFHSLC